MHEFDPYLVTFNNSKIYKELLKNNPCYWDIKNKCWVISRYQDVIDGLKNYNRYTSNYGITLESRKTVIDGNSEMPFFELDPPQHTYQRRIINRILSSQLNNDVKSTISNIFISCFDSVDISQPVDVVNTVFTDYPIMVISSIFGIDEKDTVLLKTESKKLFNLSPLPEQLSALHKIGKFFYFNTPDKIKKIIEIEFANNDIDEKTIIAMATSIVIAGHETVTSELSNMLYNCYTYPDQYSSVISNAEMIPKFVQESLKHRYTSQFVIRTSTEDHKLYDKLIKKGDTVLFLNGAANIDYQSDISELEAFDIHRDYPKNNLAFSYGPHSCPGSNLAKIEMEIALLNIINLFPYFDIVDMRLVERANLSGLMWKNMYVKF